MEDVVIFVSSVQLIQEVTPVLVQMAPSYTRTDYDASVNMHYYYSGGDCRLYIVQCDVSCIIIAGDPEVMVVPYTQFGK